MVVSCIDFKEDISSFMDGELEEHKQSALTDHLSGCSECTRDHKAYKNVGRLLQSSTTETQNGAPDIWAALSSKMPGVCEVIQEDLSAYLDGELIAPAKEGVNQHLEQCSVCHGKFQELSNVTRLLSTGLQLPEVMEIDIWSGIKARLNEDCVLIRSELSAFIDREVDTLRHRSITNHLTECAECKEAFQGLSESGELLRNQYQPEIPEEFDLWPAIQSKMNVLPLERKDKAAVRSLVPMRRLAAVAAAVVAGIGITMFYLHSAHNGTLSTEPITAEAYLIDQSLGEPADVAEAVVYDHARQ